MKMPAMLMCCVPEIANKSSAQWKFLHNFQQQKIYLEDTLTSTKFRNNSKFWSLTVSPSMYITLIFIPSSPPSKNWRDLKQNVEMVTILNENFAST